MRDSRCVDCRARLDALVSGDLVGALRRETEAHLGECVACARVHRELAATVGLLRRAGDEALPDGFEAALHRRLVAAGRPPEPLRRRVEEWLRGSTVGRALAGAAGLVVGAAATFVVMHRPVAASPPVAVAAPATVAAPVTGPVAPTFRVPAMRIAVVRIDFVAEEAVDEVEFAVTLPDGLRFVSGGREQADREVRWRGPLREGSNPIPVAVRGARAGRYTLQAKMIDGDGVVATQEVVLEVTT